MYIFKNAWKSITRTKGRNLLIFIIVLIIATGSCIALSIRQSASTTRQNGLNSLSITAQITMDRKGMMERAGTSEESKQKALSGAQELTLEEMQKYANSPDVKEFYYTLSTSVNGGNISPVKTSDQNNTSTNNKGQTQAPNKSDSQMKEPPAGMGNEGDFTVIGYSSKSSMKDFTSGSCTISEGNLFEEGTSDAVCLISDELAQNNQLSVGSSITILNPNNTSEGYSLTVTGIYHNENTSQTGGMMRGFSTANDPANQIVTSYNALKKIVDTSNASATTTTDSTTGQTKSTALRSQTDGTYAFADLASYEAFKTDVYSMGLSSDYTVSSSDVNAYEQSLQPLNNLSTFAGWFLILILSLGGIILILFQIFHIRERKYEIGVLTAIGMKKGKVLLQFLTEIFLVTFMALIIGTAVGAIASVPTTNALLSTQITSSGPSSGFQHSDSNGGPDNNEGPPDQGGNFAGHTQAFITKVNSAANWDVALKLMGVGVLLTLLSSATGAILVMRYDPLKILSDRT